MAAPTWIDDRGTAPGITDGELLGHIGTGGIALVAVVIVILGTRKAAKHGFPPLAALIAGYLCGSILMGAGGIWAAPADLLAQGLYHLGIGTGSGPLGDVGMGAVALICTAAFYFVALKSKSAALMGVILSIVYTAAGGGWGIVATTVSEFTGGLA